MKEDILRNVIAAESPYMTHYTNDNIGIWTRDIHLVCKTETKDEAEYYIIMVLLMLKVPESQILKMSSEEAVTYIYLFRDA